MERKLVNRLLEEKHNLQNVMARYEYEQMGNMSAIIIDDDKSILKIANKYLMDAGFKNVDSFDDEYQGLKNIALKLPDIVILDLKLEITNGMNIAKSISEMIGVEIPILIISEQDKNELDIKNQLGSSRIGFLKKPLDKYIFQEKVYNLLEKQPFLGVA